MLNFDSIKERTVANPRTTYDLRYSHKTNKFNLSQKAFDTYNINENGFRLLEDDRGTVALKVVPNEVATTHAGKSSSSQKGLVFTASALVDMLGIENTDAYFQFNKVENNGDTYLVVERMKLRSEEDKTDPVENPIAPLDTTEEDTVEDTVAEINNPFSTI